MVIPSAYHFASLSARKGIAELIPCPIQAQNWYYGFSSLSMYLDTYVTILFSEENKYMNQYQNMYSTERLNSHTQKKSYRFGLVSEAPTPESLLSLIPVDSVSLSETLSLSP